MLDAQGSALLVEWGIAATQLLQEGKGSRGEHGKLLAAASVRDRSVTNVKNAASAAVDQRRPSGGR